MNKEGDFMISVRVKNYFIVLLVYLCSIYHFVFASMARIISSTLWGNGGNDSIFETIGVQEFKLRSSLLPIYGFETFALMTLYMIFDYWLIRKSTYPQMSLQQFLDAFLFSQVAYIGYIYHLYYLIIGINVVWDGVLLWFVDVPMLFISVPLSFFIFKKRMKRIMSCQIVEDREKVKVASDIRTLTTDYIIVWFITFMSAVIAYWMNHNK